MKVLTEIKSDQQNPPAEEERRLMRLYYKEWRKNNRERIKKYEANTNHFVLKPARQCVGCLYRIGFTYQAIAKILFLTKSNVCRIVNVLGVAGKRTPSKISRGMGRRILHEEIARRLVLQDYRREKHALKLFDETRHWWNHPVRIAHASLKISNKIYRALVEKKLKTFKCLFCGCNASELSSNKRRSGLKYCSKKCQQKARFAADKKRFESDPEFRERKRAARKKCYHRTRLERPEVIRAEIRRKLADPMNRIIRSHRLHIYLLVKSGFMIKTRRSLEYLGCSPAFLKKHLESQFKPGMNWDKDNYGKVWHIDHIFPLKPRKPHTLNLKDPKDCARVFNWKNLRPMFGKENTSKSNKVIYELVSLPETEKEIAKFV
jgi:hypothetical protein